MGKQTRGMGLFPHIRRMRTGRMVKLLTMLSQDFLGWSRPPGAARWVFGPLIQWHEERRRLT